tara:strand:- start:1367 stop:2140 length:774 start_codon:yes stop_codon:yes gene_type:complete
VGSTFPLTDIRLYIRGIVMKLLDTSGGNTKLAKNNKDLTLRVAGCSLMPDKKVCPMQIIADCWGPCLQAAGRGGFDGVKAARQARTDWYHADRLAFIAQLKHELGNFLKLCQKNGVECWVRLNVLSDVQWELATNGSIPQSFPEINFYDYTKVAKRLTKMPRNYRLMFSYSKAPDYQGQVQKALLTDVPMSVVFYGPFPTTFMGKEVVDGDKSDILNLDATGKVVALKYKVAKGKGIDPADHMFVVNTHMIPTVQVA